MFRDLMCSDATTYGNEGKENYFASNETFCVSILDSFVSCGRKKKKFVRLPSSRIKENSLLRTKRVSRREDRKPMSQAAVELPPTGIPGKENAEKGLYDVSVRRTARRFSFFFLSFFS